MEAVMIFKVEKRRSRQNGKLQLTRCYYLRYRIGDMAVDRWKSLGATDFQVANKKAQEFIQEKEREAAGILEPKLVREAAQRPLVEHLNDYEADLLKRGRAGRGGRGARLLKSRILRLLNDCGWKLSASITADSFIAWRNRQMDSARTLNHYLQGMISFLNWMERGGRIKFNPLKNVSKVDGRGQKKRVRRAFTDDELCKLVQGSGPRGIIYFTAARTGLRWEELRQLRGKTHTRQERTAERYQTSIGRFKEFLGNKADRPIAAVTPHDCQKFYDDLAEKRLAPATLRAEMKTVSGVFNYARRLGLIATNPAAAVELPERIKQVKRKVFTPAQVQMLIDAATPEWKTCILLAYYAGFSCAHCNGHLAYGNESARPVDPTGRNTEENCRRCMVRARERTAARATQRADVELLPAW
jgi:integrase